jgi:hypothetical protein
VPLDIARLQNGEELPGPSKKQILKANHTTLFLTILGLIQSMKLSLQQQLL